MAEEKVSKVKNLRSRDAKSVNKSEVLGQPVRNLPASQTLSDAFPNAQQTPVLQTTPWQRGENPSSGFLGLPSHALGAYRHNEDVIQLDPKADVNTTIHEAAHAAWEKDLTLDQKLQWETLHNKNINNLSSIKMYEDDPSHSFASSYGRFASDPEYVKKSAPDVYNFLTNLGGFEYSRQLRKRD